MILCHHWGRCSVSVSATPTGLKKLGRRRNDLSHVACLILEYKKEVYLFIISSLEANSSYNTKNKVKEEMVGWSSLGLVWLGVASSGSFISPHCPFLPPWCPLLPRLCHITVLPHLHQLCSSGSFFQPTGQTFQWSLLLYFCSLYGVVENLADWPKPTQCILNFQP